MDPLNEYDRDLPTHLATAAKRATFNTSDQGIQLAFGLGMLALGIVEAARLLAKGNGMTGPSGGATGYSEVFRRPAPSHPPGGFTSPPEAT